MKHIALSIFIYSVVLGGRVLGGQIDEADVVTEAFDLALIERLTSYHPELLAPEDLSGGVDHQLVGSPIHWVTYPGQIDEEVSLEYHSVFAFDLPLDLLESVTQSDKLVAVPEVTSTVLLLITLPLMIRRRRRLMAGLEG